MTLSFVKSRYEQFEKRWLSLPNSSYKILKTPEKVHILSQGYMAQPKLLLIPDYNAPIDQYCPFIRAIEDKFAVLTADLYGQGRSDPERQSLYTIDKFVGEFEYILDNQSWT